MNKQDEVNWSSYSIEHAGWNDLSELQQRVADEIWCGYNFPPVGLEEMTENDWWHNFMTYMPILVFNLQVYRGKDKSLLPMRVFLDGSGSGLAVSWEYSYKGDAEPKYYRVGCHHNWIEISATMIGQHIDQCKVCGRIQERDSSD